MDLFAAARWADRDVVYDAYTGEELFKAQFATFDGSKPDGSFERRRTVSVAPGVVPAPRRVVRLQGQAWIMGELMLDTWRNKPIRQTCSAKLATDFLTLLTPGQAALRDPDGESQYYGYARYLKMTTDASTNAAYEPFYLITVASTEQLAAGAFLRSADRLYSIRGFSRADEGFLIASCDQIAFENLIFTSLEDSEVTATFAGRLDPVTEAPGPAQDVPGILMAMYKLYSYQTQADVPMNSGDRTLIVAKSSITPKTGQTVTILDQPWSVQGYTPFMDAWNVHLRRA